MPETAPRSLEHHLQEQADAGLAEAGRDDVVAAVGAMIAHPEYPCLGARSVFRRDDATVVVLDDMSSPHDVHELARALAEYGRSADPAGPFVSFVAVFRGPEVDDERHFEQMLWQVLPKTLLHLNLSGNSLTTLSGLELPNLVWLDASSNQLQV